MEKFNWGLDLLVNVTYNRRDGINVVDIESKLRKMSEYKEAKQIIDQIRKAASDK